MESRSTRIATVLSALSLALMGCALTGCSVANASTGDRPAWHQASTVADSQGGQGGQGGGAPVGDGSPAGGPSASDGGATRGPAASTGHGGSPTPGASSGSPSTSPSTAAALKGKGLQLSTSTMADGSVALTFDDGPGPQTPQILALLKQYHVQATFCVVGVDVQAHHDLVKQIVADGHTICNHSWKHDEHLGNKSPDAIRADLQKTNDEIHKAVPDVPIKYFRHPAGNFTVAAVEVCQSMGMIPLGWNVDPRDWDTQHNKPGPALTTHIETTIRAQVHPGSIVLSHDGGGDRTSTVAAYTVLIPELQQAYTLKALPTT
jgi:peptidoglycan-N-acetylglucosamine deacetylase